MHNTRYATLMKTHQGRVLGSSCVSEYTNNDILPESTRHNFDFVKKGHDVSELINENNVLIQEVSTDKDLVSWIVNTLSASPMGQNLLQEAVRLKWSVQLESLENGGFNLDYDQKTIILDNYGFDAKSLGHAPYYYLSLVPTMARALRDMCHEVSFNTKEYDFDAEAMLQFERIRAADIDTIAIYVGWELRAVGHDDIWRHMLASQDGDLAQIMVNIMGRYPTANYDGIALAHVFRQWFADEERVDTVDFYTLEHMDTLVADQAVLGNGKLKPKHINMIAFMFDGKTYLKDLELVILKDPYFTSMNDTINQTHLFQIVYDSKVTIVNDIPFRDAVLAKKFH